MDNHFLMGILNKSAKRNNLIQQNKQESGNNVLLLQIQNLQQRIKNENSNIQQDKIENTIQEMNQKENQIKNKKDLKNMLLHIIGKLEEDVDKVSNRMNHFNEEKKQIVEMNQKEIEKLKSLIRKLYKVILSIYQSFELNRNARIQLLEKLKQNIQQNTHFIQNINDIHQMKNQIQSVNLSKMNMNASNNQSMNNSMNQSMNQSMNEPTENLTIFNLINKNTIPQEVEFKQEKPQPNTSAQQKKEEKILNLSKKVSRKLDEISSISNQEARTSLNQFMKNKLGTNQISKNNSSSSNIQTSNTPSSIKQNISFI